MRSRLILFFICYVLCSPVTIGAQEVIEALPRWMISGHFNLGFPQPPANKFMTHAHPGYQIEAQYRLQYNKPFTGGAYFNESTVSKYVLRYTQSSGAGDIDIKEKANTRRIEAGITAGIYPEINWLIQPYLQGRVGFAIYQTSSILTDRDTQEEIDRIPELTSAAPAYGLDLGFHIVPNIWYIRGDIRIGYVGNTSTTYMVLDDENKGTSGFPIDYFETRTSAGQWLKISAGVSYLF